MLLLALRRPLVWLIVLAIVAYGHSATLVQLLGPAHRHASPGVSVSFFGRIDDVFRDIRAWRAELRERLLPHQRHAHARMDGNADTDAHRSRDHLHVSDADNHAHSHAHAAYQRHRHDPRDDTVLALDGMSDGTTADAASPAAGSAALPLALAPRWLWPVLPEAVPSWRTHRSARWTDAALRLPERPPRA